jgi:hypothetical protein
MFLRWVGEDERQATVTINKLGLSVSGSPDAKLGIRDLYVSNPGSGLGRRDNSEG